MAGMLQLEVATPERMLLKEQVREVEVPGAGGALGILPGHAPLLSELGNGRLSYVLENGHRKWMAVCGGYVEVQSDRVRILADSAENADEIDVNRAAAALKRAEERILNPLPGIDVARALNAVARAQARLAAIKSAR
ncbi:MAG: F0F1 ATP synthase subunit epsilon [Candidatus Solibacter usitatus]|nr:F0F1 ATP synthase subunit epsilon [Candidatus Solibacter usitatus]